MSTKHTVTHPDGTVSKRTSANRVYPFAVEVGPADPAVWRAFYLRAAQQYRTEAAESQALLDSGTLVRRTGTRYGKTEVSVGWKDPKGGTSNSVTCDAEGEYTTSRETAARYGLTVLAEVDYFGLDYVRVKAADMVRASTAAHVAYHLEQAEKAEAKAEKPSTGYTVFSWHSTLALANKAVGNRQCQYAASQGHALRVVSTTI